MTVKYVEISVCKGVVDVLRKDKGVQLKIKDLDMTYQNGKPVGDIYPADTEVKK